MAAFAAPLFTSWINFFPYSFINVVLDGSWTLTWDVFDFLDTPEAGLYYGWLKFWIDGCWALECFECFECCESGLGAAYYGYFWVPIAISCDFTPKLFLEFAYNFLFSSYFSAFWLIRLTAFPAFWANYVAVLELYSKLVFF